LVFAPDAKQSPENIINVIIVNDNVVRGDVLKLASLWCVLAPAAIELHSHSFKTFVCKPLAAYDILST
jgi:hypothetical protein